VQSDYCIVLITAPNRESGRQIARRLVEERLAACVNLLPGITSFYHWEGQLNEDEEVLLICKTRHEHFERLQIEVKAIHPYQVPEVIALPLTDGLEAYLHWVDESVRRD